jgi:hypothetical protein
MHKKRCGHDFFCNLKPMTTVPNFLNLEGLGNIVEAKVTPLPFLKDRTTSAFCSDFFFEFSKSKTYSGN